MKQKPKVLITGADGLLGRHAVEFLTRDYQVLGLVHSIPSFPIEGVEYKAIDFSGNWSDHDLPEDVHSIVHLAQSSHFREFPDKAVDIFHVNINSTARLLDFAYRKKVKRFVYASSGGIYGSSDFAFHENSPVVAHGQLGYYLGSKLCGEILAQNYSQLMDVTIMRFFFMYGLGQRRTMLIPRLIDNVRNNTPINLQGSIGIRINPVHVSDGVKALSAALNLEGSHTINIAGPEVLSLREIGEIIGRRLGRSPIFNVTDAQPPNLIGNIEAMQSLLHNPTVALEAGIEELISQTGQAQPVE